MTVEIQHRQVDAGGGVSMHVAETGAGRGPAVVCLHGWPEDASAFEPLMGELGESAHVLALDLPEIGGSRGAPAGYDKRSLAEVTRNVIVALGLNDVALVGHDAGGMVAYAYLRAFPGELARAAILNTAVPGVDPWSEVIRNPQMFHFAFHATPDLPELLVTGHEAAYFDFFFKAIAGPRGVSEALRKRHVEAYARPEALSAGFELYRAFKADETFNAKFAGQPVDTPVLCLRGDRDHGRMDDYLAGLRRAGLRHVRGRTIENCGHFSPEEQPRAVAQAIGELVGLEAVEAAS
jgi:pimeloyl-ACP methyl ester carboxylesterase